MENKTKKAAKGRSPTPLKSDAPVKLASPSESGKGLPYAPVDWPNPGDVWTWKVGKRIRNDGIFKDRFIFGPESLQEKPGKQLAFASKVSLQRYIETQFPGSDIDAFFGSFIWDIPADLSQSKENLSIFPLTPTPLSQLPPSPEKELTNEKSGGASSTAEKATPKRKSRASTAAYVEGNDISLEEEEEEEYEPTKGRGGKSPKKTPKAKDKQTSHVSTPKRVKGNSKDTSPAEEGTPPSADATKKGTGSHRRKLSVSRGRSVVPPGYADSRTPIKCKTEVPDQFDEAQAGLTHEEFDGYVNSLDEMLASPFLRAESSFDAENITMAEARERLSSLLAMGFPNLASSNKLNELSALSSKLLKDPNVSPTELSMLNLIQEIPLSHKNFLEAKGVSMKAAKYFGDLEAKTASIASLRTEYSSSKDDMEVLQAEEGSVMSDISELERQIANLQARRQQMTQTIKSTNKKIVHFTSVQKRVMETLPKIVREIQKANSDKPEWEFKKRNAAEEVLKTLEKFAPIGGFSF